MKKITEVPLHINDKCRQCPYRNSVGFICGNDTDCLKTRMMKIMREKGKEQ